MIRRLLSGFVVTGFLLGTISLSGCGDPEEGSAPKLKGTKDEIQKAMLGPSDKAAPAKKK